MPRKAPKEIPSAQEIMALVAEVESRDSERDRIIKEMRDLRMGEFTIDMPEKVEVEEVRSFLGYTIVEHIVGSLTANPPKITIPPASESQKDESRASKLERVTAAILRELERQQGEAIIDRFIESAVVDGIACMRLLYAPQLWKGYPRRKKDEEESEYISRVESWKRGKSLPLHLMWLDPLTVHPIWGESGLVAMIEHDRRSLTDLNVERWNVINSRPELLELARKGGGVGSEEVDFVQFWRGDTVTYLVNGEVVHHSKHAYGRPPYIYISGITPSLRERKWEGLSVLFPLQNLLRYFDSLLSQSATAIRMWCWPTPVAKVRYQMPGPEGSGRIIEVRPGETITLYEDEDIGFLTWQGNAPDMARQLEIVQALIQRAGLSNVFFGTSLSGDSGYLVNQLLSAARVKFKPIINHVERGLEDLICLIWDIIENQIRDKLHVYSDSDSGWLTLSPDDINGYRQVRVSVSPVLPTDTYAISSRVINELHAKLRDRSSAMEEIGIEQPDEMKRRILLDELLDSQPIKQMLIEEVARKYGLKMQEEEEAQAAPQNLPEDFASLPPALQQAVLNYLNSMQGVGPEFGPPIMASPTAVAVPETRRNLLGRRVRPAGVNPGNPGGPRMGWEG